jgi:MCP family monocarboxylic acid transporter-like MFS transporter 10
MTKTEVQLDDHASSAESAKAHELLQDELNFPDGGLRAWLVVLGTSLTLFSTVGFVNTWGVFQAYYETTYLKETSASSIAWIGSIQYFLVYVPSLFSGRLFDLGYLKIPFGMASTLLVVAVLLLGQCHTYWQVLLCQGVACGLSCGMMFGPSMHVLGHWFKNRIGFALGIAALGPSLGGTIFPILIRKLIPMIGFSWTMRAVALVIACMLLISNFAITRRLPPREYTGKIISFAVLKNGPFMMYTVAGLFGFMGAWTISTYIDTSAQDAGISPDFSPYLISIINASTGLGRTIGGLVMDKTGPVNLFVPMNFATALLTFLWPFARTKGSLIAVSVLYGICSGPYTFAFLAPLYGLSGDAKDIGGRLGMATTLSSFGDLVGLPIAGALLNTSLRYKAVGIFGGSMLMASVIGMLMMKVMVVKGLHGKI